MTDISMEYHLDWDLTHGVSAVTNPQYADMQHNCPIVILLLYNSSKNKK